MPQNGSRNLTVTFRSPIKMKFYGKSTNVKENNRLGISAHYYFDFVGFAVCKVGDCISVY